MRRNFVLAGLKSKEKSTLRAYFSNYKRWMVCAEGNSWKMLPACPEDVGEFLISLVDEFSLPVIKQTMAGINFFHRLFGFEGPCGTVLDGLVNDYVAKFSSKPNRVRDPILIAHLEKIFNMFCFSGCSLFYLRSLGVLILGFFGFLRFSDFCNLKISDVNFGKDKVEILIHNSKTDRKRVGQKVVFDLNSFPAKFLKLYFRRFKFEDYRGGDFYVFMSMRKDVKGNCLIFRDKRISYSSCSRIVKDLFEKAGVSSKFIKLHSLRIGGASEASRLGVPDFRIGLNGRWKSDSARRLYQRDEGIGEGSVSMVLSRNLVPRYSL